MSRFRISLALAVVVAASHCAFAASASPQESEIAKKAVATSLGVDPSLLDVELADDGVVSSWSPGAEFLSAAKHGAIFKFTNHGSLFGASPYVKGFAVVRGGKVVARMITAIS